LAALNSGADTPDLALILTADPATAAARIRDRGTRHRFETGVASAARETALYRDAAARLAAYGYPLLTIDTTHRDPATTAHLIAERIAVLTDPLRGMDAAG
jgi:dTMP kinase